MVHFGVFKDFAKSFICWPQSGDLIYFCMVSIKGRRDERMTPFSPFSRTDDRVINDDDDEDVQTLVDVLQR